MPISSSDDGHDQTRTFRDQVARRSRHSRHSRSGFSGSGIRPQVQRHVVTIIHSAFRRYTLLARTNKESTLGPPSHDQASTPNPSSRLLAQMMQQSQGSGHGMMKQKRPGHMPPRSPPLSALWLSWCGRWGSARELRCQSECLPRSGVGRQACTYSWARQSWAASSGPSPARREAPLR